MAEKVVHGWYLHAGDRFSIAGAEFTALAEPTGEFNTYIKARAENGPKAGEQTEVFIWSEETVTVYQ